MEVSGTAGNAAAPVIGRGRELEAMAGTRPLARAARQSTPAFAMRLPGSSPTAVDRSDGAELNALGDVASMTRDRMGTSEEPTRKASTLR